MKRPAQLAARIVLVLLFAASGLAKLVAPDTFEPLFDNLGLPHWFVPVTGAVELLGAALIASFDETRARAGAGLLAGTMAVATILHLVHDPAAKAVPAFALMLLAAWVAIDPLRAKPEPARA